MKIITEELGGHFKASLEGKPEIHHHGSTEDEAIGKLIKSRGDLFRIEVERFLNGKKIEAPSVT